MSTIFQKQKQFLQRLKLIFDHIPVPTKLVDATPEANTPALLVGFDSVGENDSFVQMEFSFVADPNTFASESMSVLQTFAAIRKNVDSRRLPDLYWLTAQINNFMPLGFFGILEEDLTVYLKANTLLVGELVTDEHIRLIDLQTGVVFYSINLFYDLLGQVAEGEVDAREAWKRFDFTVMEE